ncbi:MAG: hypothetical protein ACLSA6_12555 [Holdemania massiliensis]
MRREQTEAVFTVRDGGEGIAEKILRISFRPFILRAPASRMPSMGSTGLIHL